MMVIIIQSKTIVIEGGLGSYPIKYLIELVQNPAILDNLGGYTCLVITSQ